MNPTPNDWAGAVCAASQLVPRPVAWLWPQRLALGKLAVFDGDPERGKSLVALDLCARLSTGRPWPDGAAGAEPGCALVLSGEDGNEDTVVGRLRSLGADLDRVFVFRRADSPGGQLLHFPSQAEALDAILAQTRPRLVVIDPLMAFLDAGAHTSVDQTVRRALGPLADLAEKHRCAILFIRHLNKSGGRTAVYRGGGSIAIAALCRSDWLIADDPGQSGRRVLAQIKNNLAPPQPSLAFEAVAGEGASPSLRWLGTTDWTAAQLLAAPRAAPPPAPRDRAREFLAGVLATGPRTSREIWELAAGQALSRRTLVRAAQDLRIRCVRAGARQDRVCYWLLPGQKVPDRVRQESDTPLLDNMLDRLNEQYPPPTPLDDI